MIDKKILANLTFRKTVSICLITAGLGFGGKFVNDNNIGGIVSSAGLFFIGIGNMMKEKTLEKQNEISKREYEAHIRRLNRYNKTK